MNIKLIVVGKTDEDAILLLCDKYFTRIKRYINFEFIVIKDVKNTKNMSEANQKKAEGEKILPLIDSTDCLVLLDEKGLGFTSRKFANFIEKQQIASVKNLIFLIGGPYGFSEEVYKRANYKISLSEMTFSHQIIRLLFAEQLYRAFTIINNESYHHD